MSLGELCNNFAHAVDELDLGDGSHAARLAQMVTKLAKDIAALIADYGLGEIPALLQRIAELMAALAAEAEDPEDRQRRYQRQAALLNLLVLSDGITRFRASSRAEQRKAANVDSLRDVIADALQRLVPED